MKGTRNGSGKNKHATETTTPLPMGYQFIFFKPTEKPTMTISGMLKTSGDRKP
jgi:hypothetical protein